MLNTLHYDDINIKKSWLKDYKLNKELLGNYTIVFSSSAIEFEVKEGTFNPTIKYRGEFQDDKYFVSDAPYSAGFVDYQKNTAGVGRTFICCSIPNRSESTYKY